MKKIFSYFAIVAVLGWPVAASANLISYALEWTGFGSHSGASATGMVTVDWSGIFNPGSNGQLFSSPSPLLTNLIITVTGTPSDGTWTGADFDNWNLDIYGTDALDPTIELVGQPLSVGWAPWGTPNGGGGDFNLFANDVMTTPSGCWYFTLCIWDLTGTDFVQGRDGLILTSFRPKSVPSPATVVLFGIGLAGLGWSRRKNV